MDRTATSTLPTNGELLTVVNGTDSLSVAVRGHQLVESMLDALISEALPAPHELEISRLTFTLKVDLAVALHLLRCESRPLSLALNKIRNRFAHDRGAAFGAEEAVDVSNVFSSFQRHLLGQHPNTLSPDEVLSHAIAITFIEAESSCKHVRDGKIYAEVLHELAQDTLARSPVAAADRRPFRSKVDDELRTRFEKKKAMQRCEE